MNNVKTRLLESCSAIDMINACCYCHNKEEAKKNLVSFKEKWSKKYPSCVKSWERSLGNTQNLSARANCPGGILNVL